MVLVLLRHGGEAAPLYRVGWTGVDLFFVLSGFLVGGLLFSERLRMGEVAVGRFLVRRGFKIYPAFWVMVAVTVAMAWFRDEPVRPLAVVSELLFLQNYGPGLWVSTWSLAVEEHFYLLLALAFVLWGRGGFRFPAGRVPALILIGMALVFIARCLTQWLVPQELKLTLWGSHIRLDGLMFGALLAYYHHHHRPALAAFVRRWRTPLALAAAALLSTPFLADATGMFMRTLGFTLIYLGYGAVLLLMVHGAALTAWPWRVMAFTGQHSYGIYLWHLPIGAYLHEPIMAGRASDRGSLIIYLSLAIVGGIVLSRLIEVPFLHLRDRYFPARSSAAV